MSQNEASRGKYADEEMQASTATTAAATVVPVSIVEIGAVASPVVKKEKKEDEGPKEDPPMMDQLKEIAFGSKINVLYACVPLAFLCHYGGVGGDSVVFALSFFALVPLAALLGDLTEDIALRTNDAIGALINVTFGNATELIISLSALRSNQYAIITNSLVGSILGNMLLVLGSSLIAAGYHNPMTKYNAQAAQIYMSTLLLSCFAFLIPTCFYTLNKGSDNPTFVLQLSQELSVALIIIYGAYIFFQVKSHKSIFDGEGKPEDIVAGREVATPDDDDDDDDEEPKFSLYFAIGATAVVAVLISFLSDMLVDTMTPAADSLKLGFHFTSLVLVPIVGNVAEHASAILMANKGKVDIAFGVALGSSIQIAMFAMPFIVLVSFFMGKELDLNLTPFIAGCTFASVLVTYTIVSAGSSTWLSGLKLLCAYAILVLAFLRAPDM